MGAEAVTVGTPYVYCIPPHTHALMRFRVHRVLGNGLSYYTASGVTVDRETGRPVGTPPDGEAEAGPVAFVGRDRIDAEMTYAGVAPERAVYFSSFERFIALNELALVRYGVPFLPRMEPPTPEQELDRLRRRMMDAHPDHGGTEEDFTEARAAYEDARRRLAEQSRD